MNINEMKVAFDSFLDEKITPLKNQHKVAILLGAIIVPLVLFVVLFYSPKNKEITGLKSRKVYLVGEIKKVEATVAQLGKHKEEKKETEKKFAEASKLLPGKKEISSLLNNISSQGTNSGLNVLNFTPKKEVSKQFYADIPVVLKVYGPYHNVGVFLDKISKLPRIVTVADINMGSPTLQDGEMFLKTTLNLLTYRFLTTQQHVQNKK